MRILLTGGTGFIGGVLVPLLRQRGDEVVLVSRKGPVDWDAVPGEVERADAVIHLAGEPVAAARWTPERLERIRASRVDTTQRIAKAIVGAAHKPRVLVSASAVGLYGTRQDGALCDEDTPPGDDVLARICVAWEAAAEPVRDAGVRVVHPRIGVVLGHGGALEKMVAPFRWFVGGPIGEGSQWLSWIHVRDAARAFVKLLDAGVAGAVNLVAPAPVTMDEMSRAIARALHRPDALRVPAIALRLALGEGLAQMLLTGQRVSSRRLEELGLAFDFRTIDDALRDLLA